MSNKHSHESQKYPGHVLPRHFTWTLIAQINCNFAKAVLSKKWHFHHLLAITPHSSASGTDQSQCHYIAHAEYPCVAFAVDAGRSPLNLPPLLEAD